MKAFFIVRTSEGTWGKALTLHQALTNAFVNSKTSEYDVNIMVIKEEATEEEFKNLAKCFTVTDWGYIRFYDNPSQEDEEMKERLFLGMIQEKFDNRKGFKPKPDYKNIKS
jgi:hypothetical protein